MYDTPADELAERRADRKARTAAALTRLGLHPPTMVCPHELRHYGDRCPICD